MIYFCRNQVKHITYGNIAVYHGRMALFTKHGKKILLGKHVIQVKAILSLPAPQEEIILFFYLYNRPQSLHNLRVVMRLKGMPVEGISTAIHNLEDAGMLVKSGRYYFVRGGEE